MKHLITLVAILSFGMGIDALPLYAHDGIDHGKEQGAAQGHGGGGQKDPAVEAPAVCQHCNMDRTRFAHSRSLVEYEDGTKVGTCSINCSVIELNSSAGKKVKKVSVADFKSKKLVDAKSATWVIGGSARGVMTKTAKWAFADKKGADAFVKESGGKVATYEEVVAAVNEEIAARSAARNIPRDGASGHGGHEKK